MVKEIRTPVEGLKIGMYVVRLDRDWTDSPYTVRGFRIKTSEQLAQLKALCRFVYIDERSLPRRPPGQPPSITAEPQQPTPTPGAVAYNDNRKISDELPRAREMHARARSIAKGFLESVRLGNNFDAGQAKVVVSDCVDSIIANPHTLMWLSLLKNVDEYTSEHSVNVCMLAVVLGRAEGLPREQLEDLGLCGLLHDMGKAKTPLEILNKEGALNDAEFEIMKAHTTEGYELLRNRSDVLPEAAEVAYSHHERLNGRGYPRALAADKIRYFSRIVAIVDAYDAITSNRCYSQARSSLEGLQILMGSRGSHFDPDLVQQFVQCIGVYPAGSIAELSNGEIAIVLPVRENPNKPKLLVVRDQRKKPCPERMLNLADDPLDAKGQPLSIRNLLSDGLFGIDLKQYHDSADKA